MSTKWRELVEGWSFEVAEDGARGTRVFVSDDDGSCSSLPEIGDKFGDDDESQRTCYARSLKYTYLNGDARLQRVEVTYESKPRDDNVIHIGNASGKDLPRSLRLSSEVITVKSDEVEWASSGKTCEQRLGKRVGLLTLNITRTITSWDSWIAAAQERVGKVNEKQFLDKFPPGTVLFAGADVDEERSYDGKRRWVARMTFVYRHVDTSKPTPIGDSDGWNFLLNEDTMEFDKTVPPLYAGADFDGLFA